ncbi:MAG TPA: hypothetical protein VKB09_01820, partial [Thermomicrobiales bacterium]|nr:hypothetical protein [Thermomicrobiales bacterium]
MSQQTATAKAGGENVETAAATATENGDLGSSPRRRLGSWQTSSFDKATAAIASAHRDGAATLPLNPPPRKPAATVDLGTPDSGQPTVALPNQNSAVGAESKATVALPKGDATAPIQTGTQTVQLPGAPTAPIAPEQPAPPVDAATVNLPAAETAP